MHVLTAAQRSTAGVRAQVEELLSWFDTPAAPTHLQPHAERFNDLARQMTQGRVWSFETVVCLRELLAAKDAGMRALLQERRLRGEP